MKTPEQYLKEEIALAVEKLYGATNLDLQVSKTRKEFVGDYTLVTFPLLKISKKNPEATANEIGEYLKSNVANVADFNVIKGFLNISLKQNY